MSADPEQEFLADGIAEDVITAFSRYPSLFVIARNSSFTYKGRPVDVKTVGRELGQLGRTDEARGALQTAVAVAPALFEMYVRQRAPWFRPEDYAHMLEGLHKAGMPEQSPQPAVSRGSGRVLAAEGFHFYVYPL
jgi:hypothetical protein